MNRKQDGFALPTVLISSIILLILLVTAVSATVAIRNALQDQYYTELASAAAESGTVMATACLNQNGGQASWSDDNPLRPNTDCSGKIISGKSGYVLERDDVRTYFVVSAPLIGAGNIPVSTNVKGYSEVLRSSSGIAWRVWSSDTAVALATANDSLPVGSYIDGAWTTAPPGYLLTDGSAVSRTTYANLFAVIGTTYGSGDGSTTFNLPDTRGRVLVQKSTDTEFDVMGETYGAKTHTLTVQQIPSHSHNFTYNGTEFTDYPLSNSSGGNLAFWVGTIGSWPRVGISNTGGGQAHNNIQPSIVVNRAIKY